MSSRRPVVVLVVLLAAIALAIALFLATSAPTAHELERSFRPAREYVAHADRRHAPAPEALAPASPRDAGQAPTQAKDPAAREALRHDIVRALEKRGIASTPRDPSGTDRPREAPEDGATPAGPGLHNRIGGHERLMARLNGDFMPLADECMDQARERRPDLSGLVAIEIELLAERDIGAIVESAEAAPDNAVDDAELVECLQQSLLSMSLPGDAVDGRERLMISLRTDADDE